MKIGDEVYIHGFVDEVRKDVVIIKNADEIIPSAQSEYRLDEWCTDCKEYDTEKHCCPRFNQVIRTTLDEMKSERKKGKWNGYNADNPDWLRDDGSPVFLTCSECHGTVINNGSAHWNFCPNCGARMTEEDV